MSFITSQHHQAFENFWVSNTGAVLVGVSSQELTPQSIGFFDASPQCKEENVSLANPNIKKLKRVKIKMGRVQTPDEYETLRNDSRPYETMPFSASDIVSFTGVKTQIPSRENWRQHKIALGYDGFNAKKSLSEILDDKPVTFTFILQGDPIQKFFGQNQVSYEFAVDKGLCLGDCSCVDACGKVDCKVLLDGLKKAMQIPLPKVLSTGAIVKRPITDFVKLNTITKCTSTATVTAPTLAQYEKYTISICDDGASTLSQLSAFYPGKNIVMEGRVDSVSTYSFWQPVADAAPADFTITNHVLPICGTCPTCPTTYTSVAGTKVIQVRMDRGAAAPVVTGAISTVLKASTMSGGDVYLITVPTTTLDATIDTDLTSEIEWETIVVQGASCVGPTATFSWTQCDTCGKASKEYMLILSDKDCPTGDHLSDLQAAYPGMTVAYNTTTSTTRRDSIVTLTGTSGTATIASGATSALATFATSLTVTRDNFITANSAAFLLAGITLSASGTAGIRMVGGLTMALPTAVNASGDLAGTASALAFITDEIVEGSCITSYVGSVLSDCVVPDVNTCSLDETTVYSFAPPAKYKGYAWEEKATIQLTPDCSITTTADDCCVCGLVVEGKAFHPQTLKECSPGILEYNPGDYLGVTVHVTAYSYDPTGNPCDRTKEYVTVLQEEKLPSALSGKLVQKYERATLAYQGKKYAGNVYLDELNGFELTAKPHLFYDSYRLVLRNKLNYSENRLMKGVDDMAYNFLFASGQGKSFENHINSLILSSGNPELSAVVL